MSSAAGRKNRGSRPDFLPAARGGRTALNMFFSAVTGVCAEPVDWLVLPA